MAKSVKAKPKGDTAKYSKLGFVMALPPIVFIVAFVGVPIIFALLFSLGYTGGLNDVVASIGLDVHHARHWFGTIAAYSDVFTNPVFLADLGVTAVVTVVSVAIVLAMAMAIGVYLKIRGGWLASFLSGLAVVPLFIPVVIASWAVLTFYSSRGFVRTVLANVGLEGPVWSYTIIAIIIASVWHALPFAVLMIASGFQSIPDSMIESAKDAGASVLRIVFSIIVPMASVPIVIAATFTGIEIIGSFTVPYFTGPTSPNMLGVELTQYFVSYNRPQQSIVMAFTVFVAASGIGAFYVWANFRSAKEEGKV